MKGLPKNTIAWLLFCGSLAAPSAWGFETNYDRGRVDFAGRVTDISCSVALNGGQHAGSGNVWLAPVSLAEVHDRGAGAFMKPQPFTLALSNCQLRHDGGAASQDEVRRVSIWPIPCRMERRIFIWPYRLTIIIRWIRVIKLSRRTRSKIRCVCRKARSAAACSPITLAMFRQRRKAPPAGRLPAGQRGN